MAAGGGENKGMNGVGVKEVWRRNRIIVAGASREVSGVRTRRGNVSKDAARRYIHRSATTKQSSQHVLTP